MKRRLKIVSTGAYLPERIVPSEELDTVLKEKIGTVETASGVKQRRYVSNPELETNSKMGSIALSRALENASLRYEDLDAIISASGSLEQMIPCTAALIQSHLGKGDSGTPCFDINSTCLSFVTALDMAASLIETKRYRRIAIVSSEIASVGIDERHLESFALFGDGAAAAIVEATPESETSHVMTAAMATFSSAAETCKIDGGGTKYHPRSWSEDTKGRFLFAMDGRKVFRTVLETVPGFLKQVFQSTGLSLRDFQMIIPHQASASAMEIMRRRLEIPEERWMNILTMHGNMIAASIPLGLHLAREQNRIKRGDKLLLIGTSAGFSVGLVALEY